MDCQTLTTIIILVCAFGWYQTPRLVAGNSHQTLTSQEAQQDGVGELRQWAPAGRMGHFPENRQCKPSALRFTDNLRNSQWDSADPGSAVVDPGPGVDPWDVRACPVCPQRRPPWPYKRLSRAEPARRRLLELCFKCSSNKGFQCSSVNEYRLVASDLSMVGHPYVDPRPSSNSMTVAPCTQRRTFSQIIHS